MSSNRTRFLLLFLWISASLGSLFGKSIKEAEQFLQAEEFPKAIEIAKGLVAQDDSPTELAEFLHRSGASLIDQRRLQEGAVFYRLYLDHAPEGSRASLIRSELAACYGMIRSLDECIAQCRENLKLEPESKWVEYWEFLIAQSRFKQREFEESQALFKALLEKYPEGQYLKNTKSYLERMDPPWKIDEDGIAEYSGKFATDVRYLACRESLPNYLKEGQLMLEKRLGVEFGEQAKMEYRFEDTPKGTSSGLKGQAKIIARDGEAISYVRMMTEKCLINEEGFRRTAVHELKHAGFLARMGEGYHDLPQWIREGLAVWGTEDTDDRVTLVLGNEMAAGRDPLAVLDGIADPKHDVKDYLEDALAFEWLESLKAGNVKAFCLRLVDGEPYQEIWADVSGMPFDEALDAADAFCKERVTTELGDGYDSFKPLYFGTKLAFKNGKAGCAQWLEGGGDENFETWLKDHQGHVAEPLGRLLYARTLVMAGQHEKGRKLLQQILDEDGCRSTFLDDAQFWIGASYNYEGKGQEARSAFAVLLRDYPGSSHGKQFQGQLAPAPPQTK